MSAVEQSLFHKLRTMEQKLKRNTKRQIDKNVSLLESVTSKKQIADKLIDVRRCLDQGADVNIVDSDGRTLLCLAAGHGNVLLVKLLLKHGAAVNVQDQTRNEETPLHHAVRSNKASVVQLFLANGADVNAKSKKGRTPLHVAAQLGSMNVVKILLNYGADIKSQDKYGSTLLHKAASSGEIAIVNFLLDKGADVNITDQYGQTSLHCASKSGVVAVVQLLINKGADMFKQAENGDISIHYAAQSKNVNVVQLLVNKGVDVNPYTVSGKTPLYNALRSNEMNVIAFLLNAGADVNCKTLNGETPLHTAVLVNNNAAVSLLLKKGAQVNVKANDGFTPLHYAAGFDNLDIVKLLLSYGAEINTQALNGNTPLQMAVFSMKKPLIEFLLNNGADVNIQSKTGSTLLHEIIKELAMDYALLKRNIINISTKPLIPIEQVMKSRINKYMVNTILRKGAKLSVEDEDSMTPLHLAAKFCLPFAVDILVRNGANVNLVNKMGNTPLHEALIEKQTTSYEVVKLLLTKDLNINIKNLEGKTALHLATKIEVTQIEEWLRQSTHLKTSETLQWTLSNCATEYQESSIVQLLLDFGADLNLQDNYGNTPIHEAAIYGSTIAMLLMLKKNADLDMQNLNGETPLHIAVRHQHDDLATMLIARGSDVTLTNKDGDTPLRYASIISFGKRRKLINALQAAEEETRYNVPINKPVASQQSEQKSLKLYEFKYPRKTDNLGLLGQLYETKLLSLIYIRMMNYDKIDHDILLGINIDGIGAMDDICCRCQAKDQETPFVIFIQAKHRENLTDKIKNKDLWAKSGDFSLLKYFKSYLLMREQFQLNNNDPMFEGAFHDVDCYLILYTSAIDNITKKNTNTKINEKVHDLITSKPKLQPFQYDYAEDDINQLSEAFAEADYTKNDSNSSLNNCKSDHIKELVKDFFSKLWFYTNQDKEEKIENLVKDEINKHYNDMFVASNPSFQSISSNSIFVKAHDEIQKWWMMKNATYLYRENDFFKSAKLIFLDELLAISFNAIKDNKCKVDLEFNQRFYETQSSEDAYRGISTIMSRLVKFIEKNNKVITTNINSKNLNISFSQIDQTQSKKITFPIVDSNNLSQLLLSENGTAVPGDGHNNKHFQYSKRDGTSEVSGALYRRNLICLIYLRLLHHILIDENPKLGSKIQGINTMNDICLRYRVKKQQKPVAVFMQLIHREDPNKGKLTEESFWSDHSDFSLRNHFKSYVSLKERFQGINADPMFEGDFHNIDCYFVIYTSAKENHRKKKNINKIDKIVKYLSLTSQKSEPFQHEYTDDEIKLLADSIIDDEIENLGIAFQKCILSGKDNPLVDKFIKRYHVVLAQQVLKQCDEQTNQTSNEKYRLWQFRPDFFTRDQHYLVILKKTIIKISAKKSCTENEIIQKLQSLKIKLPFEFGNLDMKFSGNEAKVRKRIHYLVDKVADLLDQHKDTKIVEIRNEDVGSGKIIEQGIVDINGGIGSAVSNLLITDTDTDMLKFNLEIENLPNNAALFLKELEKKGYDDLSAYRFKIHVTGFPKHSFEANEYDKIQVRDFMNKIWFFTDQSKQDEVGRIFTNELNEILAIKSDFRVHDYDKTNNSNHITLLFFEQVQKWWLLPNESPYLSRISKLFERADEEDIYNILLNFMNYMFISNIYSFNVSVENFYGKPDRLLSLFNKIVKSLFKIFNPKYDASNSKPMYHRVLSEKTTLCLKIHQDMEWVALIMTSVKRSKLKKDEVKQCLVAEAGPVREFDGIHREFKIYEQYWSGQTSTFRDCIKNTTKEKITHSKNNFLPYVETMEA